MIKKLSSIFLVILFLFSSGCGNADYIEPEDRLIVTSIAVDNVNNELNVLLETIDVVKNTNSDEYHPTFFEGKGKTLPNALIEASLSTGGKLLFSQCPVILLGDSLTGEQIKEIIDHCIADYQISLSVLLLSCQNAATVLNEASSENKLAGYEILQLISFGDEIFDITKNASVLDIHNNSISSFLLPRIENNGEKTKIIGTTLYEDYINTEKYNVIQSQLIFACVNELKNCSMNIGDDFLKVKKAKTVIENNSILKINLISGKRQNKDFSSKKVMLEEKLKNVLENANAYKFIKEKNSTKEITEFSLEITEEY